MALDLHQIRAAYGGTVYDSGRRWLGPGPGHSRRDRSLSLWLTADGRPILHSFAGDDFRTCAAHLGIEADRPRNVARTEAMRMRHERAVAQRRREADDLPFCADVWLGSEPFAGSPAEAYLRTRGVALDGCADVRFHPAAPRCKPRPPGLASPAPHGAMLAVLRHGAGHPTALHATYVTAAGERALNGLRLIFGPASGAAVRLAPVRDGELAVAEGIETALSFAALSGLPTWAALSTSGLRGFMPPHGLKRLTVAADSDDSGAGLAAARALAERVSAVCEVVVEPAPTGLDWNDVLRGAT